MRHFYRDLQPETCTGLSTLDATWDKLRDGHATGMMVYQNDEVVFEEYSRDTICLLCQYSFVWSRRGDDFQSGGGPDDLYRMASETKSLAGIATMLLVQQNLLSLEDTVATYIPEWLDDPNKSTITIRQLLSLSSGIESSNLPTPAANLEEIIDAPFVEPQFAYGSQPFILMSHIISVITGVDSEQFLQREFLDPLGATIDIGRLQDGTDTPDLAAAGRITLPDMLKVGVEVMKAARGEGTILTSDSVAELVKQSQFNPAYGMTVWLNAEGATGNDLVGFPASFPACGPSDVFHMIGAGGQTVTIVPEKRLVVAVSQHITAKALPTGTPFWDELFADESCGCVA